MHVARSYWGLASSHLTLYYSVRARALASFLSAICGVVMTTLLGFFLDNQRIALVTRVRVGGATVFTLSLGMLVWALVIQHEFEAKNVRASLFAGLAHPRPSRQDSLEGPQSCRAWRAALQRRDLREQGLTSSPRSSFCYSRASLTGRRQVSAEALACTSC